MIFLSKKQLIPSLILLNVILLPCILPLLIFFLIYQEMRFLLVAGLFLSLYVVGLIVILKTSSSKNEYLIIEHDRLDLHCSSKYSDESTGIWHLYYNEIIRIDYYKATSIKGWFCLYGGLVPKCVFITIENLYGFEESTFIGYLDLNEVKQIASLANTELVIH